MNDGDVYHQNEVEHMLCVEAAAIDAPVQLAAQQRWQAAQKFEYLARSSA